MNQNKLINELKKILYIGSIVLGFTILFIDELWTTNFGQLKRANIFKL